MLSNKTAAPIKRILRHSQCEWNDVAYSTPELATPGFLSTCSVKPWSRKALERDREYPAKVKEMQHNEEKEIPAENDRNWSNKEEGWQLIFTTCYEPDLTPFYYVMPFYDAILYVILWCNNNINHH